MILLLASSCHKTITVIGDHFLFLQEPSAEENGKGPLTVAQKKAQNIMESFENPFRMVSNSCACEG